MKQGERLIPVHRKIVEGELVVQWELRMFMVNAEINVGDTVYTYNLDLSDREAVRTLKWVRSRRPMKYFRLVGVVTAIWGRVAEVMVYAKPGQNVEPCPYNWGEYWQKIIPPAH
jgi:hypothetical protein